MRSIIKKVNLVEVEVLVYNTATKKEETHVSNYCPEAGNKPLLPTDCIEIGRTVLEEKEVKLKLSPEDFVKYATQIED